MISPYKDKPVEQWSKITQNLIEKHPISTSTLVKAVDGAWKLITEGELCSYKIGSQIKPRPQIMGFLLHEIIPLEIIRLAGKDWRREETKNEKDIVCISKPEFSFEIKTSSNKNKIFGNRSYGQTATNSDRVTKVDKSGFFLAINFEKFTEDLKGKPKLYKIRFGWLDSTDWKSQASSTGQQSSLKSEVEKYKLFTLWERD